MMKDEDIISPLMGAVFGFLLVVFLFGLSAAVAFIIVF